MQWIWNGSFSNLFEYIGGSIVSKKGKYPSKMHSWRQLFSTFITCYNKKKNYHGPNLLFHFISFYITQAFSLVQQNKNWNYQGCSGVQYENETPASPLEKNMKKQPTAHGQYEFFTKNNDKYQHNLLQFEIEVMLWASDWEYSCRTAHTLTLCWWEWNLFFIPHNEKPNFYASEYSGNEWIWTQ